MICPECKSLDISHHDYIVICNVCGRAWRVCWIAPRYDDVFWAGLDWLDTL